MRKCVLLAAVCIMFSNINLNAQTYNYNGNAIVAVGFKAPKKYSFKTADDCKKYNKDIIKAADWLANTPINKDIEKRDEIQKFMFTWIQATKDVNISLYHNLNDFLTTQNELFMVYSGAVAKYMLTHKTKNFSFDAHYQGILTTLDFYKKNHSFFNSNYYLTQYIRMKNNGELETYLRDLFKSIVPPPAGTSFC